MKKTLALLSVILLFQFFTTDLFAQQESKDRLLAKNTFTLNLSRLILNEARFGFESQFTERQAFRAILGIKYPVRFKSFSSYQAIFTYPYHFSVSSGVYVGGAYNYILGVKSRIYVSPEIYYTYNFYNNKYYHNNSGQSENQYTNLQSMKLHKTGLKILFGKKVNIVSNEKIDIELDFYAGIGIQYRAEETTVYEWYGGKTNDYSMLTKYETPKVNTNKGWGPTINLGVLMGLSYN